MEKAKIYCEVTCGSCGTLAYVSRYYKNTDTIRKIKKETEDWVWDAKEKINLCPECRIQRKSKKEGE